MGGGGGGGGVGWLETVLTPSWKASPEANSRHQNWALKTGNDLVHRGNESEVLQAEAAV